MTSTYVDDFLRDEGVMEECEKKASQNVSEWQATNQRHTLHLSTEDAALLWMLLENFAVKAKPDAHSARLERLICDLDVMLREDEG